MTCHLSLDNFFVKFHDLWVIFKGLEFLKQTFVSRRLKYLNFDIMKCSSFLNLCLSQKTYYCRKLIVFLCLQFTDCYIWPRICLVVWFLCFNHYYGIFWKVSLKKSWCCRKHVFVFEIVSLKGLNKFWSNYLFPFWQLGKKICSPLWKKVWRLFHFGNWLLSQASRKVLMCSLFLDAS